MNSKRPSVSIAIPAYNTRFFEVALASALAQDYENLEVLVCDDSCGTEIQAICDRLACDRLRYVRNQRNLGFAGNFTNCFEQAQGEYLKFLNDDDVLEPGCVSTMVAEFERWGAGVTLVTSKRQLINDRGDPLPDLPPTIQITPQTSRMSGLGLGNMMLVHGINFIGEPTTVMFRRADVQIEGGNLFRLLGHDYVIWADVSLWLRLLRKGDAVYVAQPLSRFRLHAGQEQRKARHIMRAITEPLLMLDAAAELGFLGSEAKMDQALKRAAGRTTYAVLRDPRFGPAVREARALDQIGSPASGRSFTFQ